MELAGYDAEWRLMSGLDEYSLQLMCLLVCPDQKASFEEIEVNSNEEIAQQCFDLRNGSPDLEDDAYMEAYMYLLSYYVTAGVEYHHNLLSM